jgi:chromate reductase
MNPIPAVATLVGSLRRDSFNRRIAAKLAEILAGRLELRMIPVGELPFYNEDLEAAAPPPQWTAFRQQVAQADAVLFVTPEYNRSLPAALKNAIDVGSRPYGKSVFAGKPAGVVSASMGSTGGYGANHQLRQALVFLDMPVLQQPEMYLGGVHKWFDDAGAFTDEAALKLLNRFADAFADWATRMRRGATAA